MANRLATETSLYLRQHADNPVDWYPWSDEAFDIACRDNRPVLLSVGYSACHWCHVMAHESFEHDETAALMNRLFVNIKVDREERPDVDRVYQLAHQLLTGRGGGWPLTMFLSPGDRRPFFGGTYFPREPRHGLPGFGDLLTSVATYYSDNADELREQGARLIDVMQRLTPAPADADMALDATPLRGAREVFAGQFDAEYGGFGGAPKFPHPTTIDGLLRHWRAGASADSPDIDALYMATLTLTRMADGGIFDHVGGGFCRYAVDRHWQIPHFEKMLYDNGALLTTYARAHVATGDERFAKVAAATAGWLISDMRSPEGGFFAARDADSEGVEGKYYVWTREELDALLDADEFAALARRFGVDQPANFEGAWHLTVRQSLDTIAEALGEPTGTISARLESATGKLLAARAGRTPPARDEKQIVSWNALAIQGLAVAGQALDRRDFVDAADTAFEFIRTRLHHDGRLLSVFAGGEAALPAYLDDHALLLDAAIDLLQVRWSGETLAFAIEIADAMLEHFEDRDSGGFWFTADDAEHLIHRSKPFADDATPSGNGIAARALQRLGCLIGETRYLTAAERTLRAAWQAICEYPHGHVSLLSALAEHIDVPEIVVIRGGDEARVWRDSALQVYAPGRLVFAIPDDEEPLPGALAERRPLEGQTVAYRCAGTACDLPVTSFEALASALRDRQGVP